MKRSFTVHVRCVPTVHTHAWLLFWRSNQVKMRVFFHDMMFSNCWTEKKKDRNNHPVWSQRITSARVRRPWRTFHSCLKYSVRRLILAPVAMATCNAKWRGVFPHVLPVSLTMVSERDRWGSSQRYLAGCQVAGLLTVSDSRGNRQTFLW